MKTYGLGKSHKLCSTTAIERLFDGRGASVRSALAYPIRAVWAPAPADCPTTVQFFISVPKKKLHHAVDRVTMRRRIREQYRLLRPELVPEDAAPMHLALIYVADTLVPTPRVRRALQRILPRLFTPES